HPPMLSSCVLFHSSAAHQVLHSFPTRRSSDLECGLARQRGPIGACGTERVEHVHDSHDLCRDRDLVAPQAVGIARADRLRGDEIDRKSTRLNSSHGSISYAVFCLKKKKKNKLIRPQQGKTQCMKKYQDCKRTQN